MEYLNNDVGYSLWKTLSLVFEAEVGKKNFRGSIQREIEKRYQAASDHVEVEQVNSLVAESFPFPEGSEPLDSTFYIERLDTESLCRQTIIKPGALLRIKAPQLMGKTSLISRLVDYAGANNYRVVRLEFNGIDRRVIA
jgi:AAA-like domain